ncbi:UrcA family protein [Henriciella sp.]|uniref:UrcA family protein n=1 Tax=Henriciella sp. TaxID=1968823 RepID=UPI0026076053|nr:UrcA family protein [Henriciella sp.]
MSRTVLAGIITATLIAAPVAPAFADQANTQKQMAVKFSGADLADPAGARIVLDKIEEAAEIVCGVRNGSRTLTQFRLERKCVRDAVDTAIESLGTDPARRAALDAARAG